MLYKALSEGAIKDVDSLKGVVTGYLSKFGNVDSDNDIMEWDAMQSLFRKME